MRPGTQKRRCFSMTCSSVLIGEKCLDNLFDGTRVDNLFDGTLVDNLRACAPAGECVRSVCDSSPAFCPVGAGVGRLMDVSASPAHSVVDSSAVASGLQGRPSAMPRLPLVLPITFLPLMAVIVLTLFADVLKCREYAAAGNGAILPSGESFFPFSVRLVWAPIDWNEVANSMSQTLVRGEVA
eukprot:2918298-Amphidinium_carterae.1